MSDLKHGEFELDGYLFSGSTSAPLYVVGMGTGVAGTRTQDADNPVGDGRVFGRDYLSGPTWAFDFRAGPGGVDAALSALAGVTKAWRSAPRDPGDESVLRYGVGDRTRRVYGRARQFSQDPNLLYALGYSMAVGEFDVADHWHYADTAQQLTVTLIPGDAGGLVSPLVSPLTTVAGGQRQGLVSVTGDAPAPMEITFRGPVTNPKASSTGWQVALNTTIAYDQTVTVDTRRGTVLRNDGASLGGTLSRHTYLPEARLHPGSREIVFAGTDATGTASCTVAWRPTYYGF